MAVITTNRKKIFIVDDSTINLKIARNVLIDLYDVYTIPNAEKMFSLLETTKPDMILLDVLMPGLNGYESIKRLKDNGDTKEIPIIFITAKSDPDSEFEGFSLGAVDFIPKPFVPQILLKRVEVHLMVESQKEELKFINANLNQLVEKKTVDVLELQNAILLTIGELVESRDNTTGKHNTRVAQLVRFLTDEMISRKIYSSEMKEWDIGLICQSSLLHDVGKITIHDSILLKPGPLTPEEFDAMKKHAENGERIINSIQQHTSENTFLHHAKIMAGTHHEKWDGSGYPNGLRGEGIPLEGRIMAIVDVYEAITSERPYKHALSHEEALKIILDSAGTHFDPKLVEPFAVASSRGSD